MHQSMVSKEFTNLTDFLESVLLPKLIKLPKNDEKIWNKTIAPVEPSSGRDVM